MLFLVEVALASYSFPLFNSGFFPILNKSNYIEITLLQRSRSRFACRSETISDVSRLTSCRRGGYKNIQKPKILSPTIFSHPVNAQLHSILPTLWIAFPTSFGKCGAVIFSFFLHSTSIVQVLCLIFLQGAKPMKRGGVQASLPSQKTAQEV